MLVSVLSVILCAALGEAAAAPAPTKVRASAVTQTVTATYTLRPACATGVPKCPDAHSTVYTATDGRNYKIQCGIDYNANDLASAFARTMQECADMCALVNNCKAVSFVPVSAFVTKNCFFKPGPVNLKVQKYQVDSLYLV